VEGLIVSLAVDPPVSSVPGLHHNPGPIFRPRYRSLRSHCGRGRVEVVVTVEVVVASLTMQSPVPFALPTAPHPSHLSHSPLARAPPSSPRPSPTRHRCLQSRRNGNRLPVFNNTSTSSVSIVLGHSVDRAIASRVLPEILQDVTSGSGMGFRIGAELLLLLPFLRLFRIFPSQAPRS
jgi:hypothetical protein